MVDILKDLQACAFRGVQFPILSIKEIGSQDLAIHKKADRDGAFVEGTGLNPFQFQIKAAFINGLSRGKNETWNDLFPAAFLQVRDRFRDREGGILDHPFYGEITVKPVSFENTIEADTRNGVFVDLVVIESTELSALEATTSAVSLAKQNARDLDSMLGQLNPAPESFFPDGEFDSLEDFVDSVTSVTDQASLLKDKTLGKIAQVSDKLNRLGKSLNSTAQVFSTDSNGTTTSLGSLGNGKVNIQNAASALFLSLYDISQTALVDRTTGTFVYTVPRNQTVISVAITTRNSLDELLNLNPHLLGQMFVKREDKIRYYEKR